MRIFASWSGEDSRLVAELAREWLPNVLQGAKVWVSSQNIAKGDKWSLNLWESLSEHDFGLIFVTKANHNAPWILFEAGALSKAVKSRAIPILCNVNRIDIAGSPLSQLQNAFATKDEMLKVVEAINLASGSPLLPDRVRRTFEKWWPDFSSGYDAIEFATGEARDKSGEEDATDRLTKIETALGSLIGSVHKLSNNIVSIENRSAYRNRRHFSPLDPDRTVTNLGMSADGWAETNLYKGKVVDKKQIEELIEALMKGAPPKDAGKTEDQP